MWVDVFASAKANRVFRFCAWWTLLVTGVVIALLLFPEANVGSQTLPRLLLSVFFGVVGMVGAATSLILLVGMFAHLVKVSRMSAASKLLWMFLFIALLPVGEVIYFFAVYGPRRAAATV